MKKRLLVTGLAVLISASMLITGCGKAPEEEAAASILDDFVDQLKEKNYLL